MLIFPPIQIKVKERGKTVRSHVFRLWQKTLKAQNFSTLQKQQICRWHWHCFFFWLLEIWLLEESVNFGGSGSEPQSLKMSVIAYFWQSLPCWLIWDRFQVVTSWAELAQLKSGGILGVWLGPPTTQNVCHCLFLTKLTMLINLK